MSAALPFGGARPRGIAGLRASLREGAQVLPSLPESPEEHSLHNAICSAYHVPSTVARLVSVLFGLGRGAPFVEARHADVGRLARGDGRRDRAGEKTDREWTRRRAREADKLEDPLVLCAAEGKKTSEGVYTPSKWDLRRYLEIRREVIELAVEHPRYAEDYGAAIEDAVSEHVEREERRKRLEGWTPHKPKWRPTAPPEQLARAAIGLLPAIVDAARRKTLDPVDYLRAVRAAADEAIAKAEADESVSREWAETLGRLLPQSAAPEYRPQSEAPTLFAVEPERGEYRPHSEACTPASDSPQRAGFDTLLRKEKKGVKLDSDPLDELASEAVEVFGEAPTFDPLAIEDPTEAPAVADCEPERPELGDAAAEVAYVADVFASVGVDRFGFAWLDDTKKPSGEAGKGYGETTAAELARNAPRIIDRNERSRVSASLRFRGEAFGGTRGILQVEDVPERQRALLEPFALLTVETSPGSHHVLIALAGDDGAPLGDEETRITQDRLARRFASEGVNEGPFGALRLPGTLNCKPARRRTDGSFPRVRVVSARPGARVTPRALYRASLLAPPTLDQYGRARTRLRVARFGAAAEWPDYGGILERAPKCAAGTKHEGRPDEQRAAWWFASESLARGWSEADVAEKLVELSEWTKRRGKSWATKTVKRAARRVEVQR